MPSHDVWLAKNQPGCFQLFIGCILVDIVCVGFAILMGITLDYSRHVEHKVTALPIGLTTAQPSRCNGRTTAALPCAAELNRSVPASGLPVYNNS
jgi:hypothetical protein